eukprot:g3903.t1
MSFASYAEYIYANMMIKYFKEDLPDLLGLTANTLKEMPWPTKIEDLDRDVAFRLIPILTGILVLGSAPFILAFRPSAQPKRTYHITRMLLLKGMGLVYLFAFLTSAFSSRALFGKNGLTDDVVSRPSPRPTPAFDFLRHFFGNDLNGDMVVEAVSWFGILLSILLIVVPSRHKPCWAGLPLVAWATYLSLVNLGSGLMLNYGWEWETLEVGFLMIFLCPLLPFNTSPPTSCRTPHTPPILVIFLLRFGVFRIMYGAGMSKLGRNASACWKDLTCTMTHYETQPMPNPFAWFFHRLPAQFHKLEVLLTFFEQLVLPWLALVPDASVNTFAAVCELFFQLMVVGTGNYAWINYIGALPCLSLLDDAFFVRWFGMNRSGVVEQEEKTKNKSTRRARRGHFFVVRIVDSLRRASRRTVDPEDRLLQTPCDETRDVVAHDRNRKYLCADLRQHCENIDAQLGSLCPRTCGRCVAAIDADDDSDVQWHSLDFYNLPGDVSRRPRVTSPYHSRLSWQVWIETTARMERFVGARTQNAPSLPNLPIPNILRSLVGKILSGDADAVSLMSPAFRDIVRCDDADGVHRCRPPTAVRLRYFLYTFSSWEALIRNGTWWKRVPLSRSAIFLSDRETTESRVEKSSILYCAVEERQWLLLISVAVVASMLVVRGALDRGVDRWTPRVIRITSDRAFELCVFAAIVFGAAFCSDYSYYVGSFVDAALSRDGSFSKTRYYEYLSVGILFACITHAVAVLVKSEKGPAPAVTDSGSIAIVTFAAAASYISWCASGSCAVLGL